MRNILRLMFRLHMIGEKRENRKTGTYNSREHQETVLKIARESVVLLKNEEECLPLDAKKVNRVAVIGQNAAAIHSTEAAVRRLRRCTRSHRCSALKSAAWRECEGRVCTGILYFGQEALGQCELAGGHTKRTGANLPKKRKHLMRRRSAGSASVRAVALAKGM
ncbi:MAG: glycoside hydrolase family 3 C-terminal domain-containing protein [Roseburia sp.]